MNRSATDLSGVLVTKWIVYIWLFDFEVRHVPGNKHIVVDRLSWKPRTKSDDIDKANEVDINNFINVKLNAFSVVLVVAEEVEEDLLGNRYLKDS